MPTVLHQRDLIVQTPHGLDLAHPAIVRPRSGHVHVRAYANYVPAAPARGTYKVPQRPKHDHPAPTTTTPLCGVVGDANATFTYGACTRPAGHVLIEGTAHYSGGVGWFRNSNEAHDAALVLLARHGTPAPVGFRNHTGF